MDGRCGDVSVIGVNAELTRSRGWEGTDGSRDLGRRRWKEDEWALARVMNAPDRGREGRTEANGRRYGMARTLCSSAMAADVRSFNANFVARLHSGARKAVASKEAARLCLFSCLLRPSLFVQGDDVRAFSKKVIGITDAIKHIFLTNKSTDSAIGTLGTAKNSAESVHQSETRLRHETRFAAATSRSAGTIGRRHNPPRASHDAP